MNEPQKKRFKIAENDPPRHLPPFAEQNWRNFDG